jgi:hypothetical protein
MRRTRVLALAVVLAACGVSNGTTTTAPAVGQAPPPDAVEVAITGVDVGSSEATIRGDAPTPCNDVGWTVVANAEAIDVVVWAEPLAEGESCAQVIEPFEISVSYETPARATPVIVNGEEVGRVGG